LQFIAFYHRQQSVSIFLYMAENHIRKISR
jgi:hypothetical protein